MGAFLIDTLLDTLLDVIKITPILFLIYLLLEWMEHQAGHKMERFLERHRRLNPLAGTIFGLLPSCGLAGASSSLYATGVISAGTLITVYLASSDEMLSIMISMHVSWSKIWPILLVKLIVGLAAGYMIDIFSRHRTIDIESFCEREHDDHSHGIFYSALTHTVQVFAWLLVITFVFNTVVGIIGEETIRSFILAHPNQSVLVSTFVGIIPSCASSIVLTKMYIDGVLSFAAVCAGLLVNAGTGMMVLWHVNPNWKDNVKILVVTWACGLIAGLVLQLIGL